MNGEAQMSELNFSYFKGEAEKEEEISSNIGRKGAIGKEVWWAAPVHHAFCPLEAGKDIASDASTRLFHIPSTHWRRRRTGGTMR